MLWESVMRYFIPEIVRNWYALGWEYRESCENRIIRTINRLELLLRHVEEGQYHVSRDWSR